MQSAATSAIEAGRVAGSRAVDRRASGTMGSNQDLATNPLRANRPPWKPTPIGTLSRLSSPVQWLFAIFLEGSGGKFKNLPPISVEPFHLIAGILAAPAAREKAA
jgi:hypothetical protein